LARPENEPQTELGKRLRKVREMLGNEGHEQFSVRLNLPKNTLANYETGLREPPASVIAAYNDVYNIDTHWLLTGKGEMFTDAAAVPASQRTVDPAIFRKIAARVEDVYKELQINPSKAEISEITAELYNEILAAETDLNDPDELEPAIAVQIARLKRSLAKDPNNPKSAVA